jgi:F-type H+-transporting ATPase subunit b
MTIAAITTLATFAAEGGNTSGIGALGINGWAFISQLVSFIIVLFVLGKWMLPIVQRTLEQRQNLIREGIENAEKAKQDLAEATKNAEQIIQEARRQANETIEAATRNANRIAQQIEVDARERAEKLVQQNEARIQQEASRARMELSRAVINLSINAASRVIERSVDNKDNRRLVQEFVTTSDQARNN